MLVLLDRLGKFRFLRTFPDSVIKDKDGVYIFHLAKQGLFALSPNTRNDPLDASFWEFERWIDCSILLVNPPTTFLLLIAALKNGSETAKGMGGTDTMKGTFMYYIMKGREGELFDYISQQVFYGSAYSTNWTYPTLLRTLRRLNAPERILDLAHAKYNEYMSPAPPMPDKRQKELLVLEMLAMFDPNREPQTQNDESFEFKRDGWEFRARRSYLPDPRRAEDAPLVTERDVEYFIQADNYHSCRVKREMKHWACWVYVNRHGYMCNGSYPSIVGTDWGVQWYRY
jgi:hypothetical protein